MSVKAQVTKSNQFDQITMYKKNKYFNEQIGKAEQINEKKSEEIWLMKWLSTRVCKSLQSQLE